MCAWCNDGYSVQSGGCITAPTANCASAVSGKCVACTPGYYWNNGACTKTEKYSWSAHSYIYTSLLYFFGLVLF